MIIGVVAVAAITAMFAFRTEGTEEGNKTAVMAGDKVEVFYFHLTRRCVTCQAVENVSREAVSEIYADEIKQGKVTFRALNIEDKETKPEAERAKATGQCLLVISGETRIDLTSEGFMYAKTNPDRLKEELKKAIDPLLKEMK
jgi:hypothetical protein